jgi:hypothetical protein
MTLRVVGFVAASLVSGFALVLVWYIALAFTDAAVVVDCAADCGTLGEVHRRHGELVWLTAFVVGAAAAGWRIFGRRAQSR